MLNYFMFLDINGNNSVQRVVLRRFVNKCDPPYATFHQHEQIVHCTNSSFLILWSQQFKINLCMHKSTINLDMWPSRWAQHCLHKHAHWEKFKSCFFFENMHATRKYLTGLIRPAIAEESFKSTKLYTISLGQPLTDGKSCFAFL